MKRKGILEVSGMFRLEWGKFYLYYKVIKKERL